MQYHHVSFLQAIKLILFVSFLSLVNGLVQAEVLSDSITCSDLADVSTCTSSNTAVNASAMIAVANEIMQFTNSGGDITPTNCVYNGGLLKCNVSPDPKTSLLMTCTPDYANNTSNCVARDLSAQTAVQLDCNATTNQCVSSIDTDLLCSADQSLCESMVARTKYCELGFCQVPKNTGAETIHTSIAPVLNILPPNLKSVTESFLSCDPNGAMAELCAAALASDDNDAVIALVDTLMPKKPDAPLDTAVVAFNQSQMSIQNHLYRVRTTAPAAPSENKSLAQYYYTDGQWLPAGTLLAANSYDNYANDAMPAAPVAVEQSISNDGRLGVFINAAYIDAEENDTSLESSSETSIAMLTVGIDYRFTNNFLAGMAMNYADSTTKFDLSAAEASQLDGQNISLSSYASLYFGSWFVDGSLIYSASDYVQRREINCAQTICNLGVGDIKDTYNSEFNGSQYGMSLSGGYDFNFNAFSFTPFAQYNLGKFKTDEYTETAADPTQTSGAQLHIGEQQRDVASINIGSYFRYVFSTTKGVFIPNARVSYNHNVQDNTNDVEGSFAANPDGVGFSLQSDEADSSYYVVAAGFNFQLKNGNAGFFEIESLEGYNNLTQMRYTAGWRWEI
ncbi:MAG: autotransporter outer membrane beta-barrel domain-containing protein [Pseudomonadales bacterium]|nr:autotransporter outer membrane beta-barrel domain-containing protein [Pseudomonadales bacterium]